MYNFFSKSIALNSPSPQNAFPFNIYTNKKAGHNFYYTFVSFYNRLACKHVFPIVQAFSINDPPLNASHTVMM